MKEESNQENKTPEVTTTTSKKDTIKQRLMEMKNTYNKMIELRKDNLDSFKKIDMSKCLIKLN